MTTETTTLIACSCLTCGQELGDADTEATPGVADCDAPCTNPACPRAGWTRDEHRNGDSHDGANGPCLV